MDKIFILGLHKTGTSSLQEALEILGYKMEQDEGTFEQDLTKEKCEQIVRDHSDVSRRGFPFVAFPELLKELHPDATFILTTRNEDDWFFSVKRNWRREQIPMHDWFYGGPMDEERYINKYREHVKHIRELFPGILEMDIVAGDGWDKLCPYLGREIPHNPFPHKNKTLEHL